MNIVTGYRDEPHVTSWQDRDLNQGIFGSGTYILNVGSKLAASIITNNEIRIADGTLVMQGCQGVIQKGTYDTITIDNGSQGMMRSDLICAQYQRNGSTGVESMSLVVIKGTPAASNPSDPTYTSGDIQGGDNLVQVPLYRVWIEGLTLTAVSPLVDVSLDLSNAGTSEELVMRGAGSVSLASEQTRTATTFTLTKGVYLVFFSSITQGFSMYMATETTFDGDALSSFGFSKEWGSYNVTDYHNRVGIVVVGEGGTTGTLSFSAGVMSGSHTAYWSLATYKLR